jgi:hypothetical protein
MQPAGLCYMVTGVDYPAYRTFLATLSDPLARARWWRKLEDSGAIPKLPKTEYRGMSPLELAPWPPGLGAVNFAHLFADGCNPKELSQAMMNGRMMAHAFIEYAREHLPGMRAARIVATAAIPGVRETRRIQGRRRITAEDFRAACHFADDIASYDFPIDMHNSTRGLGAIKRYQHEYAHLRLPPGKTYGIPLSCLLPKGVDNLAVAGRSLSADRPMHGSARTMTACFAMGQGVGLAAAMAAKKNLPLHRVDIAELQRRLRRAGARIDTP